MEERTRRVRTRAADGIRAVETTAETVLDRGGDVLRRADEFLQDTKRDSRRESRHGLGLGQALRDFALGVCWAASAASQADSWTRFTAVGGNP